MSEKNKKQKKGSISEEDASTILERYSATTVLALLQEVAHVQGVKIDWNALVKKTKTGISNAREYQMLWRYLAYHHTLPHQLEDGAEPLDDGSDLEYDLEAFPAVSSEASTEAAACVKVLIASGLPSDSSLPNSSSIEAPLTINIPSGKSSKVLSENSQRACSVQGTNIIVPVSVQKQPQVTVTTAEGLDANGATGGSLPVRRKRKPWSAEEDMELMAAVKKCGEGNWANILKGEFKGDRTASQLSQRWNIIRKRQPQIINLLGSKSTVSQLSSAQLAARHAVNLALNVPGASNSNTLSSTITIPTAPVQALPGSGIPQTQPQSQQSSIPTSSSRIGTSSSSQIRNLSSNSSISATAVSVGARIASPEAAASLRKAAKGPNAVHIMPTGGSVIKPLVPACAKPLPIPTPLPLPLPTPTPTATKPLGARHKGNYVSTGVAIKPPSTFSVKPSVSRPGFAKPVTLSSNSTPSKLSRQISSATSKKVIHLTSKQEVKIPEEKKASGLKEQNQEDQVCIPDNATSETMQETMQVDQPALPVKIPEEKKASGLKEQRQEDQACIPGNATSEPMQVSQPALPVLDSGKNSVCSLRSDNDQVTSTSNQNVDDNSSLLVKEGCEKRSTAENDQAASINNQDVLMDERNDKVEVVKEAVDGTELQGEKMETLIG